MSSGDLSHFFSTFSYSPETVDKYRRCLIDLFSSHSDLTSFTSADFLSFLNSHDRWGSSAKHVCFSAIKKYIRWKFGNSHDALNCKIKRINPGPQRTLTKSKLLKLLEHFNTSSIIGKRDLAICSLLVDSGIRASEICRLELKYLNLNERYCHVIIKGGSWGKAVFSTHTSLILDDWLGSRKLVALPNINNVFVSLGGIKKGSNLTREGLQIICRSWGKKSGIGPLSPHDFRRTFATISIQAGAPTRVIQVAGRWTNIKMVELYTASIDAKDIEPWFPITVVMR